MKPSQTVRPGESDSIAVTGSGSESLWIVWAARATTLLVFLASLKIALQPFFSGANWMLYEMDDFFYYLKVAQNLAHGAGSTFNGIVPTNGYHPLWLLLLTAVSFFSQSSNAVMGFIAVSIVLATTATYLLARSILRSNGATLLTASALAAYIAWFAIHLFMDGMEVTLTIPLMLSLIVVFQNPDLWLATPIRSAGLGLLISAMVLSRLDSILFACFLLAGALLHPDLRVRIRPANILATTLGLIPLAFYFLSNQLLFHVWLPVSGMAKQLKTDHLPSAPAWHSVFARGPLHLINLLPIFAAILLLPVLYRRLSATRQVLFPVALIFPFFYIFLLSCLSDWGLWDWYLYSFRAALCVSFACFCLWKPTGTLLRMSVLSAAFTLAALALLLKSDHGTEGNDEMYQAGLDLQRFAQTHPGTYAMGDRSGMVGFLLPYPLIQTEGLVMDRDFLQSIRRSVPLTLALAPYHVRYYVVSTPTLTPYTGCFAAEEPYQAGPKSPHMRDQLCQAPLAHFHHASYTTYIFDLQPERSPAS